MTLPQFPLADTDDTTPGLFVVLHEHATPATDGCRLFTLIGGTSQVGTAAAAIESMDGLKACGPGQLRAVRGSMKWSHGRVIGIECDNGEFLPAYIDSPHGIILKERNLAASCGAHADGK